MKLSYGVVTGTLLVTFLLLVFVFGSVLPFQGDLAVAASTLAVAAMFNPLRHRIQAVVDRRFNRTRYDALRTAESFAQRLRSELVRVSQCRPGPSLTRARPSATSRKSPGDPRGIAGALTRRSRKPRLSPRP